MSGEEEVLNVYHYARKAANQYFEMIDSEEKQYILGWIYSKGRLFNYKNIKHSGLSIKSKEQDKDVLRHIQNILSSKKPIVIKVNKGRNYAELTVANKAIYNDLLSIGLVPDRYTERHYPLNLITNHAAFILGYFEGNGTITISDAKKGPTVEIDGPKPMIVTIRKLLEQELSFSKGEILQSDSVFKVTYSGFHKVNKLGGWLYGWNPAIYLERKKDKFDELSRIAGYSDSVDVSQNIN